MQVPTFRSGVRESFGQSLCAVMATSKDPPSVSTDMQSPQSARDSGKKVIKPWVDIPGAMRPPLKFIGYCRGDKVNSGVTGGMTRTMRLMADTLRKEMGIDTGTPTS